MFTFSRGRPASGCRRGALLACALLLVTAFTAVNAGSAAALGEQCSGSNARGLGAFLQDRAQTRWSGENEFGFNGSPSGLACSGSQGSGGKPKVSYVPTSSALALRTWGAEDGIKHEAELGFAVHFAGTDIAPSGPVGEEGSMLSKMKSALGSDVVVVPVTQTAIAIVSNPPALPGHAPCTVPRINATQLQKVFSGEIKNWRQLSAASDSALGGDCDQAISRVVREESAGTTYQFKHYLDQVNPAALPCTGKIQRTWSQLQAPFGGETPANVEWPRNSGCQEGEGPITAIAAGGEGEVGPLQFVSNNHGTITYASLPEAQDKAPKQIIDVHNGAKFVSPATEAGAANCSAAKYPLPEGFEKGINVDWSQVYGSDPKIGEAAPTAYPICTLTWDLVPANAAGLFGGKAATTVRDYLRFVVYPEGGSAGVRYVGYQDLPGYVAEAGAVAIGQIGGEEKEESGGGEEKEEEPKEEPPVTSTGTVLCNVEPEAVGGVLRCPAGQAFTSDTVYGGPAPESTTTFKLPSGGEGELTCPYGNFYGLFKEDGTSHWSGLKQLVFECESTFPGSSGAGVWLENAPYDASRFVYLGTLAPQGAFVVAKEGGGQILLRIEGFGSPCVYLPSFLGGQVVNGGEGPETPTRLIMEGTWQLAEGSEEACPPQLQQSSQLTLSRSEASGGPWLYVAAE
jgi:ABC-type phosphate transport system substrate-binding protein